MDDDATCHSVLLSLQDVARPVAGECEAGPEQRDTVADKEKRKLFASK